MKNIFLKATAIGVASFSFAIASAQQKPDSTSTWTIYYSAGWKQSNLSEFNERLKTNNYPSFKDNSVTTGIGLQENRNREVGIFEIFASRMQRYDSQEKIFSFMDFLVNLNFGYQVFKSEDFSFYPTAGLGYGGQYLSIAVDRNFDEILKNPVEQNVTLWNHNLAINAALNADYIITSRALPNDRMVYYLIGLRGGYNFAPLYWWTQNNGTLPVENSPESSATGIFVQLKLGIFTKPN